MGRRSTFFRPYSTLKRHLSTTKTNQKYRVTMTLQEYITSIEDDITTLQEYEANITVLDCCDNRELEVLENVLTALKQIKSME